ncbi:hypothetical protein [Saccharomonospora sp. CUA-673]|uniref:hypothetical protein n=1 Tax=Saccharomonospora sp. CUA-673 TaxID=1904969 RepID=UPI0009FB63A2|nr:hypothetical protein [Saccharomonospora sp. CUA-673]
MRSRRQRSGAAGGDRRGDAAGRAPQLTGRVGEVVAQAHAQGVGIVDGQAAVVLAAHGVEHRAELHPAVADDMRDDEGQHRPAVGGARRGEPPGRAELGVEVDVGLRVRPAEDAGRVDRFGFVERRFGARGAHPAVAGAGTRLRATSRPSRPVAIVAASSSTRSGSIGSGNRHTVWFTTGMPRTRAERRNRSSS